MQKAKISDIFFSPANSYIYIVIHVMLIIIQQVCIWTGIPWDPTKMAPEWCDRKVYAPNIWRSHIQTMPQPCVVGSLETEIGYALWVEGIAYSSLLITATLAKS